MADGRKVRLAGIDTPELARDDFPEEPFAQAALEELTDILRQSAQRIRLLPAREAKDRYGRLLAHAYAPSGQSIQARLLQSGLALTNIQPPNLSHIDCYLAAEKRARRHGAGLWRDYPLTATDLNGNQRGLVLVQGTVRDTRRTRKSHWINLYGGVALRIAESDLADFRSLDFSNLPDSRVEARGWLTFHRDRPTLRIRHPAALQLEN